MDVRRFDGIDDLIVASGASLGNPNGGGAFTIFAVVRPDHGVNNDQCPFSICSTTQTLASFWLNGNTLRWGTDNPSVGIAGLPIVFFTEANWIKIAITRGAGAGSVAIRFHRWDAGSWVHSNGDTLLSTGSGSATRLRIGGFASAGLYKGDVAVAAYLPSALSDAAIEALATSNDLVDAGATSVLEMGTTPLDDLVGDYAQSSITGTTVVDQAAPWTYFVAGGADVPLAATLGGTGALSADLVREVQMIAAAAGAGALSVDAVREAALAATAAGAGELTALAVAERAISAAFSGGGTLRATFQGSGSEEEQRAALYREQMASRKKAREQRLEALRGDPVAAKELAAQWEPLIATYPPDPTDYPEVAWTDRPYELLGN